LSGEAVVAESDKWKVGICEFLFGLCIAAQGELHVGLPGANPYIAHQDVAHADVGPASFLDRQRCRLAIGCPRGEGLFPPAGAVGLCQRSLLAEPNSDLAIRLGLSNDSDWLLSLEYHAVPEPRIELRRCREASNEEKSEAQ